MKFFINLNKFRFDGTRSVGPRIAAGAPVNERENGLMPLHKPNPKYGINIHPTNTVLDYRMLPEMPSNANINERPLPVLSPFSGILQSRYKITVKLNLPQLVEHLGL
ncbi:hypothetical protein NPIL_663321 [Nephila pilipes]|uniref:Uncharacterized protein n=1 Tax=Nephila pilipes TaxID=299642 RepID=A0A8X6MYE5_NEPPI|nr:hypothetical protein NPIL_663321 [Nephila pilipes]